MGLRYAVKERVFNFDETKTKKYVAAPVSDGVIDFSKLCKNVSLICSTHCGQVKLVLDGLLDSLEGYMDEGKTVKLGEFGTLRPTFNAKSGIEAKDVDSSNIIVREIVFTPGTQLKTMLNKMSISKYVPLDVVATSGSNSIRVEEQLLLLGLTMLPGWISICFKADTAATGNVSETVIILSKKIRKKITGVS